MIGPFSLPFPSISDDSISFSNIDQRGDLHGWSGGSGGYLEYLFRSAAKELFGKEFPEQLPYQTQLVRRKNNDFKEVFLEVDGEKVLYFAICYGFRNIQNLVQKIKQGKLPYHYVEIMACPSGCLNGGGQIKAGSQDKAKQLLIDVETAFNQQKVIQPEQNSQVVRIYQALGDDPKKMFYTQYQERKVSKAAGSLAIQW